MSTCVVVFKEITEALDLEKKLQDIPNALAKRQLIKPNSLRANELGPFDQENQTIVNSIQAVSIDNVKLLSPKLAREIRQKTMAFWLIPFGLITGLAFTKMTGLKTFSNLGLDPIAEPLLGSILGMASGLIGSYVAAASINTDINDDIGSIRKLSKEGLWLILIQTPLEIELPWELIKGSKNYKIIQLNEF